MKTQKQDLAAVFLKIESAALAVEDVSKGILAAVKSAKAITLPQFDRLVSEAYAKNGWSQKAGRRPADDPLRSAPGAVKMYVSVIRSGYRLGLKVHSYDLMERLREDILAARKAARVAPVDPEPKPPEMIGVQVQQEHALTGALWHDAVVLWEHLPDEQRALFESKVRRLLAKYRKDAPAELLRAS